MVEEDKTLAGLKELVSVYDLKAEALALIREMRDTMLRFPHTNDKCVCETCQGTRATLARADQFLKEHS